MGKQNQFTGISWTLYYLEEYEDAMSYFQFALKLSPNLSNSLYGISSIYAIYGDTVEAIYYLKEAIEYNDSYKARAKNDKVFNEIMDTEIFNRALLEQENINLRKTLYIGFY